jgi:hypothetical protein
MIEIILRFYAKLSNIEFNENRVSGLVSIMRAAGDDDAVRRVNCACTHLTFLTTAFKII